MSPARQLHNAEVQVSKETQKAIDKQEKSRASLNAKIEKAAEKADAEEKKRA